MIEIYRDIPNFPKYQVSNLGNVKSLKFKNETILSGGKTGLVRHYLAVNLYTNKKSHSLQIHKLVAITFLNHTKVDGFVVDHINNNSLDNRLENLQLITHRNNCNKEKEFVGVHFCNTRNKWIAKIQILGKSNYIGQYNLKSKALNAYNLKLKTL